MSGCIDEIMSRLSLCGGYSENNLRIVLNDYNITKKTTEIVIAETDSRQQAIKMFIVTKKVEGCTESTIRYYLYVLRSFFEEINDDPKNIKAEQIKYYLAIRSTRDKISKVSQDNELRILKSFFKWCVSEEYITKNPTSNIKAVKKEKRIKKPFSEVELELIRKNTKSQKESAIVETLYSTGCRVSELCRMNKSDINGDEIIVFGKGSKERVVYLNAKSRIEIEEYIKSRDDDNDALFVQDRKPHSRMTKSGVEWCIRQLGQRAGIEKCHPHRFRRTAATVALNRGMPLDQVQQMLGHEDIETTTIYARSEAENVKANHRKYIV